MNVLKPYARMKDSGVRWIGRVPEHWSVEPITRIGHLFKGKGGSKEDEASSGVPCVRYGDLYTTHNYAITSARTYVPPDIANSYTPMRFGDVLFAASGETLEDIGKSAVSLIETEACCGGDTLILRPTMEMDARFLGYASDSTAARRQKTIMGRGFTVVHIYGTQLKKLMLAIPPLEEQRAIARFIDHHDRLTRRYIRAQRRLIGLLEEQKQALIQRAVTRGLDPDVLLQAPGVGWLSHIPAHWEVRRLKTLFREVDDRTASGAGTLLSLRMHEGLVPHETVSDRPIMSSDLQGYKKVKPGQLVMNRMRAAIGIFGIPEQAGLVSPDYAIFEPTEALALTYYLHLFKSKAMCAEFRVASKGLGTGSSGFMRLYSDQFGTIWAPHPPITEQAAIVEYLAETTSQTDLAIARVSREIELVAEYRTRLISDVVTGKLDVRDVALPDLPLDDDADLFDDLTEEPDRDEEPVDEEVFDDES